MHQKHRRHLSDSQIELLRLVAKFRFVTVEIVSDLSNKGKTTIYERLAILEQLGYIHKRYEKKWKLLGKPAVYSVTGKGMRAVVDRYPETFTDAVIRNQYKNKTASQQLINHQIDVAHLYILINRQYEGRYKLFTKSELDWYEAIIRPLPDLYVGGHKDSPEQKVSYQLEVIEAGLLTWMIKKRIGAHQRWLDCEDGEGWIAPEPYPTLLLVCGNSSTEKRIHRLTDDYAFDFEVWTVTRDRLDSGKKNVWMQQYSDDYIEYSPL